MSLPRDRQLLSVRDACLQKHSGLQKRHSRSLLKMDCVVHPVAPGPPLSTWSPRKTDLGESAEIFAASTQSPYLINIPCHIYTIFQQTFSEKPYFPIPNSYSSRRHSQNCRNYPLRPVRVFGHDVRPLQCWSDFPALRQPSIGRSGICFCLY